MGFSVYPKPETEREVLKRSQTVETQLQQPPKVPKPVRSYFFGPVRCRVEGTSASGLVGFSGFRTFRVQGTRSCGLGLLDAHKTRTGPRDHIHYHYGIMPRKTILTMVLGDRNSWALVK